MAMPSRALNNIKRSRDDPDKDVAPASRYLTQPKPDVAIAFNRRAIMSDIIWKTLTQPMKNLARFESLVGNDFNVFHFLGIEAKNSAIPIDDRKALHQCLNNASQALFNYYEFFHDAGPEHDQAFFGSVRFFSIVANRTGFLVRIHRAVEVPKEMEACRVIPEDSNYLLSFEYQELARLEGFDQFTRSKALNIMRQLLKYAKETMCPLIQNATTALCKKLNTRKFLISRSRDDVYRHGQPGIADKKKNTNSSRAPSEVGSDASKLARGVGNMPLGKKHALSVADEPMERRQTTPRQPRYTPKISSGLKRTCDDSGDLEGTGYSQHEGPSAFKRPRVEASIGLAAE